jgi:hypothetical protein
MLVQPIQSLESKEEINAMNLSVNARAMMRVTGRN